MWKYQSKLNWFGWYHMYDFGDRKIGFYMSLTIYTNIINLKACVSELISIDW